jgi:hypothetical protein
MLFTVDVAAKTASEVAHVTLAQLQLRERYDLQEWILQTPSILGEDLLVITSEFSGFDKTAERLDVLALDRRGVLTVVELKRSAVGTAAELQALRYAAYCSTMSLSDLCDLFAVHESRRAKSAITVVDAEQRIRAFVNEPDFSALTDRPRIILGAEEFSPEITATVLWLRTFGIDISCVRLRPYSVGHQLLLDSSVIIPLPEARDFQIRREKKEAEQRKPPERDVVSADEFVRAINDDVRPIFEHIRAWLLTVSDINEKAFQTLLSYRKGPDREWITWMQSTRWEARVAIRPEVDVDPTLFVRKSQGGWSIVRARNIEEAVQVESLIELSMRYKGPVSAASAPSAF